MTGDIPHHSRPNTPHPASDEMGEFIRATYREIAERFRLSGPNAARTKVKRAGWTAEIPNHPADPLRIRVPRDAWSQVSDTPQPKHSEMPHLKGPIESRDPPSQAHETPRVRALEAHIASLREHLELAKGRADRAEQRVDAAEARADRAYQAIAAERSRADRAEQGREAAERARDGERARSDDLRARLDTMQHQLNEARAVLQTAEAADVRAELAERDRERVEADRQVAEARADRAEQGREGERARADALRDRMDILQAQLTAVEAEGAASDVAVAELTAPVPRRHWRSYGDHPLPTGSRPSTSRCARSRRGSCGSCASAATRSGWSTRRTCPRARC